MAKKRQEQPSHFQIICERILLTAALVLGTMHMLLTVARYNFDYYTYARPFECWYAFILLVMTIAYLIYTVVCKQKTLYRIKALFRRLWSLDFLFVLALIIWYPISCFVNQQAMGVKLFKRSDCPLFRILKYIQFQ